MKSTMKLFAVMLVLVLAVAAFAANKSASVRISNDATVAGTKLAAGDYKVTIDGTGPEVKVIFEQNGNVKATVTGTMTEEKTAPEYSSVITSKTADGNKIAELRLAKNKAVVKF
jgi:predicted lysophospholipase L1 biosynthesis ABC-type transport system permease subunit